MLPDLPYSEASRDSFALWEELAEVAREQQDVVIARIDASANDINMPTHGPYPSFCLFPALRGERVRAAASHAGADQYMHYRLLNSALVRPTFVAVRWWFTLASVS